MHAALEPEEEDSSDLRWALETAIAMWLRGDRDQALRWTHSAVQTATAEGRHDRAYALGRALGDLDTQPLGGNASSTSVPAVLAVQPPSEHTAPMVEAPRTAAKPTRSRTSMMQTAPYKIPPRRSRISWSPTRSSSQRARLRRPLRPPHQTRASRRRRRPGPPASDLAHPPSSWTAWMPR